MQKLVESLEQDLELDGDDDKTTEASKQRDGNKEEDGKLPSKVGLKKNILQANKKDSEGDDDEVNLEDVKDDA